MLSDMKTSLITLSDSFSIILDKALDRVQYTREHKLLLKIQNLLFGLQHVKFHLQ